MICDSYVTSYDTSYYNNNNNIIILIVMLLKKYAANIEKSNVEVLNVCNLKPEKVK